VKSALPNPGSRYGSDEEGFSGTEQNRAIKGAVFDFHRSPAAFKCKFIRR
jgi:hypothetical protein